MFETPDYSKAIVYVQLAEDDALVVKHGVLWCGRDYCAVFSGPVTWGTTARTGVTLSSL